jgi:NAD(P)-dependent dehydrogenase (short-subunit alcohol dehydrogenase family)
MSLEDHVAIVTGAGNGIGRATAVDLAKAGARVVAVDIDAASAKATADAVSAFGHRSLALDADVGDLASIDQMVRRTVDAFGQIDVLVNNAGVTRRAYIMDLTEADWERIMRVNGKGVFFCLQRVAREMISRRSGVIVNIASIAGKGYAGTSNAIYAASKGAVISLTRIAALQLARHNINVNAVCPGTIEPAPGRGSGMVQGLSVVMEMPPMEAYETFSAQGNLPGSKWRCTIQDITDMVLFLASDNARVITGAVIPVDGGQMAR